MASDIRLKTDITKVGNIKGINVYSFRYVWDEIKVHTGVLAQELINTKYADVLTTNKFGYYLVNYGKLPIEMKMTPARIEDAQKLARECVRKKYKGC